MSDRRYVARRIAVGFARALEALGAPRAELDPVLASSGAAIDEAPDSDATVPVSLLYSLWEVGARHHDPSTLPFDLVRLVRSPPHADVFAFAIQTSPTLGDALASGCRFAAMRATSMTLELVRAGGECALVQHRPFERRLGRRLAVEGTLAEVFATLRRYFDPSYAPLRVELEHSAPADARAHREFFRCPIRFDAGRSAIVLAEADLALPMPHGDRSMASYFEARCVEAIASLGRDLELTEQVRDRLIRAFPARPSVRDVAKAVGLSERTLRRRLTERGTSFESLVNETRVALARQHLAQSALSIGEIAFLTGFSDPRAFHRFFRRQTGETPAEVRALARARS